MIWYNKSNEGKLSGQFECKGWSESNEFLVISFGDKHSMNICFRLDHDKSAKHTRCDLCCWLMKRKRTRENLIKSIDRRPCERRSELSEVENQLNKSSGEKIFVVVDARISAVHRQKIYHLTSPVSYLCQYWFEPMRKHSYLLLLPTWQGKEMNNTQQKKKKKNSDRMIN